MMAASRCALHGAVAGTPAASPSYSGPRQWPTPSRHQPCTACTRHLRTRRSNHWTRQGAAHGMQARSECMHERCRQACQYKWHTVQASLHHDTAGWHASPAAPAVLVHAAVARWLTHTVGLLRIIGVALCCGIGCKLQVRSKLYGQLPSCLSHLARHHCLCMVIQGHRGTAVKAGQYHRAPCTAARVHNGGTKASAAMG
jgi:hypothetical protein